MDVKELVQKDKTFSSELFISKANNMVKRLYNAITLNELEHVDHFISDKVYNEIETQIKKAASKNCQIIYDEINVNTSIYDIKEVLNSYKIFADVEIQCLRYTKEKNSGAIVGGDTNNRLHISKLIIFKKKINNSELVTNRCRGCGTTYDINYSGICPVCGRTYDLEEIDYYIDEIR